MAAIKHVMRHGAKTQRVEVAFEPSVFSLELMGGADSLRFRRELVRFGFVDVTPPIAHPGSGELKIPTELFKSKMPRPAWSGYWHGLRANWRVQTATWVCLSGHHARARATTPIGSAEEINAVRHTGFFNEPFHDHEWQGDGSSHDESIFVYSSSARGWDHEDAPEYGAPFAVNRRCRGVFLAGCNTLVYPATRRWVRKTFPFAVVFGFMDRTKYGIHNVAPLLGTGVAGKHGQQHGFLGKEAGFWRSPGEWIVEQAREAKRTMEAQVELMVAEMNGIYHRVSGKGRDFAMIFDNHIYFVGSTGAVESLEHDFEW